MTMWIGACACGGEVVFNEPAPATVRCFFGHVAPPPAKRREATAEELVLTLDAERTVQVTLTFPYEAARDLYVRAFLAWLPGAKIELLAEMQSLGRPWIAVFTVRDDGWPRSDAARVLAWWRRELGAGLTGGNARVVG